MPQGLALPIAIGGAAGLSYLGAREQRQGQNEAAQIAADSTAQANQLLIEATERSDRLIAEANVAAAGHIKAGNEAAAKAVIKAAKIAANALLEATNASIEVQREFAAKANKVLAPTIQQGRFAADEMASMLAIPNAQGEMVPFAINEQTVPGLRAAAAVADMGNLGKKISTQGRFERELLGLQAFQQKFNNLGSLQGAGANAENALASGLFGVGANLGQTNIALGQGLANVATNSGNAQAAIAQSGAAQQAQLGINTANALSQNQLGLGSALSNNVLGLGNANAQIAQNRGNISSNLFNQLGSLALIPALAQLYGGGASTPPPTTSGTPLFQFPGRNP